MRIATKFEIVRELGRGAFGVVYEARDVYLDRAVAIKTIRDDAFSSESARESFEARFLREARSVARLQHPHIIAVHEAGRDAGQSFMAMELVRGGSLRDVLQARGRLTWPELWPWAQALLSALDYAHGQGIVHRDIKPENLMIREGDGVLKVADFGIAKALTSESMNLTSDGAILGTPSYMAPEQVSGEQIDGRADLFSACALLYECLAGCKPFIADNLPALVHQIIAVEPVPLSRHARVPPGVEKAIARGLSKDRAQRFATCAELLAALGGETTVRATAGAIPRMPAAAGGNERTVDAVLPPASSGSHAWLYAGVAAAGLLGLGVVVVAVAAVFFLGNPSAPRASAPRAAPPPRTAPASSPSSPSAPSAPSAATPAPSLPSPAGRPAVAPPDPYAGRPAAVDTTAADRAALDDTGRRFAKEVASGSWDDLSSFCTMDAVVANKDGVFEGRTLIDAYYRAAHAAVAAAAPGQRLGWSFEWISFESDGSRAIGRTANSFSVGGNVVDRTVFDNEYKKVGGRWLLHRAIARVSADAIGGASDDAQVQGDEEEEEEEEDVEEDEEEPDGWK